MTFDIGDTIHTIKGSACIKWSGKVIINEGVKSGFVTGYTSLTDLYSVECIDIKKKIVTLFYMGTSCVRSGGFLLLETKQFKGSRV